FECAEYKTRGSLGVELSVAILAVIQSTKNAFAPPTVIIEQHRPPMDKYIIGLIDGKETAEQAAIRELEEETGFKADRAIEVSPIAATDPGPMTTASMKLAVLCMIFPDALEFIDAKLEEGGAHRQAGRRIA
ncbi:hypothetical protein DFH11DRAFT_1510317, partial [Phellopilus nigrolimitatus]